MINIVLNVVRKVLQIYYIEKSYSINIHTKVIALEVLQNDVNIYFRRKVFKNVLPNTF